jgi:hypothetical protein
MELFGRKISSDWDLEAEVRGLRFQWMELFGAVLYSGWKFSFGEVVRD